MLVLLQNKKTRQYYYKTKKHVSIITKQRHISIIDTLVLLQNKRHISIIAKQKDMLVF